MLNYSYVLSKDVVVCSPVGMKEGYTFLLHISTLITPIDMPVMTCIQRKSEEHLPGKLLHYYFLEPFAMSYFLRL